jgi:hypothetical protein
VEPFGLLDSLPEDALAEARVWERHVVEVETGLPPDAMPGSPARPEFDPACTTLNERDAAKAAELGVSVRTIQSRRARYAQQGLWGLVDQRAVRTWEATGRADARLVTAIREALDAETHASTGTRSLLVRRVVKVVEATHGPGVVPLPSRNTFYKLIDALSAGLHTFASAVTRRQTANRPVGPFTPSFAARPGEQVQIDSTPIDVLVLLDSGLPVRADLTKPTRSGVGPPVPGGHLVGHDPHDLVERVEAELAGVETERIVAAHHQRARGHHLAVHRRGHVGRHPVSGQGHRPLDVPSDVAAAWRRRHDDLARPQVTGGAPANQYAVSVLDGG